MLCIQLPDTVQRLGLGLLQGMAYMSSGIIISWCSSFASLKLNLSPCKKWWKHASICNEYL